MLQETLGVFNAHTAELGRLRSRAGHWEPQGKCFQRWRIASHAHKPNITVTMTTATWAALPVEGFYEKLAHKMAAPR